MKKCNNCEKLKEYSEFHKHKGRSDGYYSECKSCVSIKWKNRSDSRKKNHLDYNNNFLTIMRNNSPSPFRSGVYSGEDSTNHHIIRRLEQDVEFLNQENSALRARVKKVNELEEKIELVLKHNGNLLN